LAVLPSFTAMVKSSYAQKIVYSTKKVVL